MRVTLQLVICHDDGHEETGRVSKVEMATPMALIYRMLFPSLSTFETPPSSSVRKSCVDIRLPLAISMICSAASWTSICDVVTHSAKMTVSKPLERPLHAVNSTHTFVSMPVT